MTPPAAPLAQLREHDAELWLRVWERGSYNSRIQTPGVEETVQALAAALLGDPGLAGEILREGFYIRAQRPWPDLGTAWTNRERLRNA